MAVDIAPLIPEEPQEQENEDLEGTKREEGKDEEQTGGTTKEESGQNPITGNILESQEDPDGINYLHDFGNVEVNNYWRLKKLEEQELDSGDDDEDEQKQLDQDSEDS